MALHFGTWGAGKFAFDGAVLHSFMPKRCF